MENARVWGSIPQPLPANLLGRCIRRRLPTEPGIRDSLPYAERPPPPPLAKHRTRANAARDCAFLQALHCRLLDTCWIQLQACIHGAWNSAPWGCATQLEQCRVHRIAKASAWVCAQAKLPKPITLRRFSYSMRFVRQAGETTAEQSACSAHTDPEPHPAVSAIREPPGACPLTVGSGEAPRTWSPGLRESRA